MVRGTRELLKETKLGLILLVALSILLSLGLFSSMASIHAEDLPNDVTVRDGDVVKHLSKVRNIGKEEARERISWQNKAEVLNERLLESNPNSFGGVWIDKDTDRVKVGRVANADSNNFQEISELGLSNATDIVDTEYSFRHLQKIREKVSEIVFDELEQGDWPIQVGIITDENKVLVHIPTADRITDKHKDVLKKIEKYSNEIEVATYEDIPREEACNWWFCDSPLRGAVGIKGSLDGYEDGIDCTAGFVVIGNSGTKYIVTAGHCEPAGNGWATERNNYTTKKIGPIHDSIYEQNGLDAMIIKIREDTYNWDVEDWIMVRGGTVSWNGYSPPSYNEEYHISDSNNSSGLVGERICVSGAISSYYEGGSCGAVHEVDISWTAGGVTTTDLVRAGYCSRDGDSGSPVFRNGKALGIHRGTGATGICNDYKYYTGMNPIIREFNYNIDIY